MPQEEPPGLDLARLRAHLDEQAPGLVKGRLAGQIIEGGRSNLTYIVGDGESRWVVRRPPLGHVLPTAHEVVREHRVVSALRETKVPVPGAITLCQDNDVLGVPFYVMEFVEGTPYRSRAELEAIGPRRTAAIADELVNTLLDLHAVVPEDIGLGDFGRPDGFLERQLRRWKKQLDSSRSRDIEGIDQLHERLAEHVPASGRPAIVHGDYRLDNVLVDESDRITAVLDWDMSTLGDPLTDLALLMAYAELGTVNAEVASNPTLAPGYPGNDEVIARYVARSGRDVSVLDWHLGFAFFKLAVILEGIFYRFSHGQTVGTGFDNIGEAVVPLVARGIGTLKD